MRETYLFAGGERSLERPLERDLEPLALRSLLRLTGLIVPELHQAKEGKQNIRTGNMRGISKRRWSFVDLHIRPVSSIMHVNLLGTRALACKDYHSQVIRGMDTKRSMQQHHTASTDRLAGRQATG